MLRSQSCPRCYRRLTPLITGPYCLACGYGSFGMQLVEQPPEDHTSRWPLWVLAFCALVWVGVFVFVFLISNGAFVQ